MPIENCGSGAMRCDNDTLRHFIVQSTSDQEFYENYPSIIQGMLALLPPEKAGVWAYPYPVPIHLRDIWRDNHEFAAGFADGNQTVFNMVTGMFGCMYMSGKITNADELNMSLIKEATELYKKIRKHIPYSSAVYPTGLTGISEDGFITLGLLDSGGKRLLLGVWKKNTEKRSVSVDISRFTGRAEAEYMYPRDFEGISYRLTDKCVEVAFPERNSAAFFVLRIK